MGLQLRPGTELKQATMSIPAILFSVVVVLILGIVLAWPHSANLSNYPSTGWLWVLALFGVMLLARRV